MTGIRITDRPGFILPQTHYVTPAPVFRKNGWLPLTLCPNKRSFCQHVEASDIEIKVTLFSQLFSQLFFHRLFY